MLEPGQHPSCATRIKADLALGRHQLLTAELDALVREHPLRETLHAERMLALYRCGRQSDALFVRPRPRQPLVARAIEILAQLGVTVCTGALIVQALADGFMLWDGQLVNAGAHRAFPPGSPVCSSARASPVHVTAWHSENRRSERERTGARKRPASVSRYARMRALTDVTSETLRRWRQSQGWDVPRMARELRRAARDSGEDVAAHHGLVKMIPQWERGDRAPRERYRLLYLKIFEDMLGGLPHGMDAVDFSTRLAGVRSRAASLPGPGEIRALEAAALAMPKAAMTPAEIRALAAEAIAHLHEVAGKLAELSALLGGDEAGEGRP